MVKKLEVRCNMKMARLKKKQHIANTSCVDRKIKDELLFRERINLAAQRPEGGCKEAIPIMKIPRGGVTSS